MDITIKFTNEHAHRIEYTLRQKYHSRAKLPRLAKLAILTEVATQAKKDLEEAGYANHS